MAGSRAVQENEVSKPPSAEAPSEPPLPFFVQRTGPVVEDESSGDEVCFNDGPLLAAPQRHIDDVVSVAAVADRGALARAKMQTLGCAKKDRKASAPDEDKKGASKQITSTQAVPRARPDRPPEPAPEDVDSESETGDDASDRRRDWCTTTSTTWWAQFFQMKRGFGLGVASLKVSLARLDLSDTDLPSLTAALEKLLQHLRDEEAADSDQRHRAPVRLLLELDLSDNGISDVGAVWLFSWLMHRPGEVRCRVLRMARNRLSDTSLEWLSALVCQQHSAIEELHLAENAITATGAAYLLLAFALHPFEAYPFLDPRGLFAPANVTLDRNPIEEPGLLARLRLRSNLRAACKDGNLRTSNFNSTPHVQLGAAFPDGANRSSTVLPLALEKVCAGGSWPSLPQLPKPQVKETSGDADEAFNRHAPRGKTFRRELLVDDEEGAGLELETVSDGLRICEIMEIPGQPGLRLGDVIVAIDGLPLWWHACQRDQVEIDEDDDAPSARFRARFRRGARLDILRSEATAATATRDSSANARSRKRFACPVCWDTFDLWNDCLEHLREFGHEPSVPTTSKLEDASGCLRRWMATCMAAARGELPRPNQNQNGVSAEKWMAVEEEKAETLLLPASIGVLGERSRMVVEALAEEASRFGFEQGCTVWTLPNGLRAQCPGNEAAVAAIAEQLLQIMHFYLPDVDDKETLGEEDEELAEWTAWLEQMLQQQAEETRRPRSQPITGPVSSRFSVKAPAVAGPPRLLLLCGLPGSGKSSLARSFAASPQWCVVNQDSLGSRQACMKVARHALASDRNVVIDRCNVTRGQRAIWTLMASEFNLAASQVGCVWLDVNAEECGQRVLQRFGHRTLPPRNASLKVIRGFARQWQAPDVAEGFGQLWRVSSEAEQEMFLADFGLTRCELPTPKSPQIEEVPQAEAPGPKMSPAPATPEQKEKALAVPPLTPPTPPTPAPPVAPVPAPVPARKEKVGSNKILPNGPPVGPQVTEEPPLEPGPSATWTCRCGEINKRRRDVCNNCGAAQPSPSPRSPRSPRKDVTVLDAKPVTAVPNGSDVPLPTTVVDLSAEAEPSSAVASLSLGAPAPEEATTSGYLGTADFWRLPMSSFDDLSPPK